MSKIIINNVIRKLKIINLMCSIIFKNITLNSADDRVHAMTAQMEIAGHFGQLQVTMDPAALRVPDLLLHLLDVEPVGLRGRHAFAAVVFLEAQDAALRVQPHFLQRPVHVHHVLAGVVCDVH